SSQTGTAFRTRGFGGPFGAPGDSNAGSSSGGGGLRALFTPIPVAPPPDPFALNGNATLCTADSIAKARQLSSELATARARIESARTPAGYPAAVAMPPLTDATLTYHGLGPTYALSITPKGSGMLRAVATCMALHIARADDVTQRKLFAPASSLFFVPQITFMPAAGLYVVARAPRAGQETFRVYKLPATPPAQPFTVRAAASCTGDAKTLATQALDELRNHFTIGSPSASWTITAHTAKSGMWYELDPGDPSVIPALLACGRIAATTTEELAQRGFAGTPVPELNYTPRLGLYLIRTNNRGFGASPSPSPSP
ncbi:MAG: hypothetical protein JO030_06460, partial [Candidatus Eremiobacteraeota bacterium]|nr:hypothetical protein [Candidatus Eremiobacteraeota bacterium]